MFNFLADISVKPIDKNNLDSYTAYLVHKSMNLLSLARFETDWLIMMFLNVILCLQGHCGLPRLASY